MATTVREFSLDYYLHDRMKYSGLDKENLADLVSIIISLKTSTAPSRTPWQPTASLSPRAPSSAI
jgi:hypothetical protein